MNAAVRCADQAAQAVRALNHVTFAGTGLKVPSEADEVIACLQITAERLPQALAQVARWLDAEQRDGRVGHDTGVSSARAVAAVVVALGEAMAHATALAVALGRARAHTNHLTGDPS